MTKEEIAMHEELLLTYPKMMDTLVKEAEHTEATTVVQTHDDFLKAAYPSTQRS